MRLTWGLVPLLFCKLAFAQGVVAIYPEKLTISPGVTQQFLVYNTTSGKGVNWSVNGIQGGNATYGTISSSGLYTAPARVPASHVVTVKAASTPSGIFGASSVSIVQPIPMLWS